MEFWTDIPCLRALAWNSSANVWSIAVVEADSLNIVDRNVWQPDVGGIVE
jgi:hypothetical protein